MSGFLRRLEVLVGLGSLTLGASSVLAQVGASSGTRDCFSTERMADGNFEGCGLLASYAGSALPTPTAFPFASTQESSPPPIKTDTGYRVTKKFSVPGEGGWDYIAVDGEARRLYVSHGDVIQVLNADNGKLAGQIAAPGAHGVALAPELHRGFTSNGKDKSVTIFDTKTLGIIKTTKLEGGTDAIVYDPFTKRVFPMNEKITVVDAESGDVVGTVDLGGDPEAGVSDGKGTIYVNLADKGVVAVVDAKSLSVAKKFPLGPCSSPRSLSFDPTTQRLFVGCGEGLVAIDATTGKFVGGSLMCMGVDASGYDSENKLVFESCAEGVISVIRQFTPDSYRLIETIPTKLGAKTMAFDSKTKNIYLPAGDLELIPDPDSQKPPAPRRKHGSFQVLVVSRH